MAVNDCNRLTIRLFAIQICS